MCSFLAELLKQIQLLTNSPDPRRPVAVIATIDKPQQLDQHIISCFSKKVEVLLPSSEERLAILEHILSDDVLADDVVSNEKFMLFVKLQFRI